MHTLALPRCSNRWNNGGAVTSYRFASPPQSSKGVIFRRILDEHFEGIIAHLCRQDRRDQQQNQDPAAQGLWLSRR